MPTKTVSHEWWRSFLTDVVARYNGAPTTIRVRDRHLEEHELGLARDLPLAAIELQLRPKEMVRLQVTQPSGALETVEIEYPKEIILEEEEGAVGTPDKAIAFRVETAAHIYFVHIGLSPD